MSLLIVPSLTIWRTRPGGPEDNEGIRGSHVDVNYDITAQNSSIISQGNQTQRIIERGKQPSEPSY